MRAAVCGLFLLAAGCFPAGTVKGRPWYDPAGLVAGSTAPAGKQAILRTVLLDQPAGDQYLTTDLWKQADSAVPPEVSALLAENGLRVGRISGNPPPAFLKLLTTESATIRPVESRCPQNEAKVVPVNGPVPQAKFQAWAEVGGKPAPFDLQNAECGMAVTPKPGEPGRVVLAVEPKAQHAAKQGWLRPNADLTGFAWAEGKPTETFPKLAFEATVGPQEYLIIGPTETPMGKLGGAFFVSADEARPRMRVLVVRGWIGPESADEGGRRPTASVAAQAGRAVARGQSR